MSKFGRVRALGLAGLLVACGRGEAVSDGGAAVVTTTVAPAVSSAPVFDAAPSDARFAVADASPADAGPVDASSADGGRAVKKARLAPLPARPLPQQPCMYGNVPCDQIR